MHIKVDIIDVIKLNFIANLISLDAILVSKLCKLVCVTIPASSDRIKIARSSVTEIVTILSVDSLISMYLRLPQFPGGLVLDLIDVLIIHPATLYICPVIELMYERLDIQKRRPIEDINIANRKHVLSDVIKSRSDEKIRRCL
jgi:hypothetical protein